MIRYKSDLFGLRTLMIFNGSAAFRATLPALFSTLLVPIYNALWSTQLRGGDDNDDPVEVMVWIEHPYTITVLVMFFSLLLTTGLNYSHGRWWEAATQLHLMTSKFADSAICLAAFHYQSDMYNNNHNDDDDDDNDSIEDKDDNKNVDEESWTTSEDLDDDDDDDYDVDAFWYGALVKPPTIGCIPQIEKQTETVPPEKEQAPTLKEAVIVPPALKPEQSPTKTIENVATENNSTSIATTTTTNNNFDNSNNKNNHNSINQDFHGTNLFHWLQDKLLAAATTPFSTQPLPLKRNSSHHQLSSNLSSAIKITTTTPMITNAENSTEQGSFRFGVGKRNLSEPSLRLPTKSFHPNRSLLVDDDVYHNSTTRNNKKKRNKKQKGAKQQQHPQKIYVPPTPSPFLQEAVHLYSLLNAVAMASLRHDVEGFPSPLAEYIPNRPFPPDNPDEFEPCHGLILPNNKNKNEAGVANNNSTIYKRSSSFWTVFYFLIGMIKSPKQRTIYNAARPFRVLGGVSDLEVQRLQQARGPRAQVALCLLWIKEFVAREHLHASTGDIPPPIIATIFAFLTAGTAAYHQCLKVSYIPFPFPHAQMTSLFSILILFVFPFLYVAFVNITNNHHGSRLLLACILNGTTILCFQGILEVSKELNHPYHTVPNDLPLNRYHSQFNETLRTTLFGYHPDWTITPTKKGGERGPSPRSESSMASTDMSSVSAFRGWTSSR